MEILDKVYNTFKNLDRDFAKSKKTRSEFITDKFGGDIEIGSTIILDAISTDADDNNPSDIEKLTFVKEIFAQIKESANTLDSLKDFAFVGGSAINQFKNVLRRAERDGRRIIVDQQSEIYRLSKGCVHYVATADELHECPMERSKVLHAYKGNGMRLIEMLIEKPVAEEDSYLLVKNHITQVPIAQKDVLKYLK